MPAIVMPKQFLELTASALNAWTDCVGGAAVAIGESLTVAHRRDVAATLADRHGSAFAEFREAWNDRDFDACHRIAREVVTAERRADAFLFQPPPTIDELVDTQVTEFESRGLRQNKDSLISLRRSADFADIDTRRRLAYAARWAILERENAAASEAA